MYSNFAYFKIILKHCTHKLKYIYIFDKYFFLSNTKNSFKTTETYQCTKTRRKHLVFLNKSKNYTSNRLGDGLALILYFKYKNNDLGGKTLPPVSSWSFDFRPNIFGITLFYCRFIWVEKHIRLIFMMIT